MISKLFWGIRGLVYKPFLGAFGFPSYIGKPVFISNFKRIFIGKKVRIFPGARIEAINQNSSITFEDNISIGQNLHIISGAKMIIGKNTTISANVLITNVDHEFKKINQHIIDQPLLIKETKIGENCFIGYGVVIQAGTTLGKQCIIGANAVVRGNFPDYCVIAGIPAKIIKRYDQKSQSWKKTDEEGNFVNEI
jgi:acetyltransferase-like isoleucine patch superfamily enzyme